MQDFRFPSLSRRRLLLSAPFATTAAWAAKSSNRHGGNWDRSRLSAVTDEIATTPAGAIGFAQLYNLKWLELRAVPGGGGEYTAQTPEFLAKAAADFKEAGIGISFLNTGMLKYILPGTKPKANPNRPEAPEALAKRIERDTKRFEERKQYLERSIRAAHIFGVRDIRIFGFLRTDEPEQHFPRIAEIISELAATAEKEGVRLLLENEVSCNVGTCAEVASMLKLIPSKAVGINWDAMNGEDLKERIFPSAYSLLPKKRLWNVQIKGHSLLTDSRLIDWPSVLRSLQKDGYEGKLGLETHIFGRMLITHSHSAIREMIRLVEGGAQERS